MTRHDAELQTKLIKAREEIRRLGKPLSTSDIIKLLSGAVLEVEITQQFPCQVAHPQTDFACSDGYHTMTEVATMVIRGLADPSSEE